MSKLKRKFDFAFSFAGEDRKTVQKLARLVRRKSGTIFFDEWHRAELWGKDLYQHLQKIYRDKARYCVVFISKHYAKKKWTKHELHQAQARAFDDPEYILPLRLDDSLVPGINKTIGYIDLRRHSPAFVSNIMMQKLHPRVKKRQLPEIEPASMKKSRRVFFRGHYVSAGWPKHLRESQKLPLMLVTSAYEKIKYGSERRFSRRGLPPLCHDCAAEVGEFHVPGCDMEECPKCGGQLIGCECRHEHLTRKKADAWRDGEDTG